jgi:hypothetical protein
MQQNGIELQVCVDGKPVREYGHDGQLFVEGHKGSSFTLKVRNSRAARTNVVVLVDGVNVITGNASLEEGYVVAALSSCEIQGWRTSLHAVTTFVFKDKAGSYTKAVTGTSKMCGVITLIAYDEHHEVVRTEHIHHYHDNYYPAWRPHPVWPWWHYPEYYPPLVSMRAVGTVVSESLGCIGADGPSGDAGIPGPADPSMTTDVSFSCSVTPTPPVTLGASPVQSGGVGSTVDLTLGVGWGEQRQDAVLEVAFKNGPRVAAMELYYTDSKGLKKAGIDTKKAPAITKSLPSVLGFCSPPR